jgi:hypothetical protein
MTIVELVLAGDRKCRIASLGSTLLSYRRFPEPVVDLKYGLRKGRDPEPIVTSAPLQYGILQSSVSCRSSPFIPRTGRPQPTRPDAS